MKIAYLSSTSFADLDVSFLNELRKFDDVYYFITITQYSLSSTIINIKTQFPRPGIYKASIYKELECFGDYIDLNKTYVINRTTRKGFSLSNFILTLKLIIFLRKLKIRILHITYFLELSEILILPFFKNLVITVHDPLPHKGERTFKKNLYRKITKKFVKKFILMNGKQTNLFCEKYNIPPDEIFISKLGPYSVLKKFSNDLSLVQKQKYILFFGRISPYKGLEYLLPAIENVHLKFHDIEFIIAGNGKYYFDKSHFDNLKYVKFINRFIPITELVSLIENSYFIICPYIEATQSGVIMSSFAFGKPVIATNVGGLSEVIENNYTGLLFEPKSVKGIEDSILFMLNNKELVKKMECNILENFYQLKNSWQKISEEISSLYKEIVKIEKDN